MGEADLRFCFYFSYKTTIIAMLLRNYGVWQLTAKRFEITRTHQRAQELD